MKGQVLRPAPSDYFFYFPCFFYFPYFPDYSNYSDCCQTVF